MKVVVFIVIFAVIIVFCESKDLEERAHSLHKHVHLHKEQTDKYHLEKDLKVNLTWLTSDQIEILYDLKADGYNVSEMQKEIWLFYNITKGIQRKNAAKYFLKYCENLLLDVLDEETAKEWKKAIIDSSSNYNPKEIILKFFNQRKNLTTTTFTTGCLPFIESESDIFLAKLVVIEILEDQDFLLDLLPNSINFLKKKIEYYNMILKPEKSIEIIENILESQPNDITIIAMKADTFMMMERFEEAIKLYDQILELKSSDTNTLNKKINAMLMFSEQMFENSMNMIYENHFNSSNLRWLNDIQKRQIRRLKAEGKKPSEIFVEISKFYQISNETIKASAKPSLEIGCIHLLNAIFGSEKAEQLMDTKMNFDTDFETKFNDFLKGLNNEGQTRAANAFMPGCQRILSFNVEESPPIMVSFKINEVPVEFIYDTGADFSIANEKLWRKIGSPHLYQYNHKIKGVGGIVKAKGRCRVRVELHGKKKSEWLYIIKDAKTLFGRNWIKSLNFKIPN